jgi:hypothetical protein
MKKTTRGALLDTFSLFIKATRLKEYAVITVVCLTGCTATVVRWNSVRMREEIMAYYNDEIMDNLIRMKEGLPFVHVDISSVSAQGISQVSGTVGGGDTESFTRTSPSMIGALRTPALRYELEQISKSEILRKLKQRFGGVSASGDPRLEANSHE